MELLKLTPEEFARMAKLIYDRTGIHLPESKLSLLSNRLRRRLRELKLAGYADYYDLMRDSARCDEELPHFLSAVTTNETYFFRNEALWKYFRETWIPEMVEQRQGRRLRSLRIWSAASSSGEEAYTAAICLREDLPDLKSWKIRLIGSDISERVLSQARAGDYNDYAVSRMGKTALKKWFDASDGHYQLKPEVREVVNFVSHNLRDPFPNAQFDFIFLRNVLMYFDEPMKLRVLKHVDAALAPGGRLYVGDVDPIRSTPALRAAMTLEYRGPNLYQKPVRTQATVGT